MISVWHNWKVDTCYASGKAQHEDYDCTTLEFGSLCVYKFHISELWVTFNVGHYLFTYWTRRPLATYTNYYHYRWEVSSYWESTWSTTPTQPDCVLNVLTRLSDVASADQLVPVCCDELATQKQQLHQHRRGRCDTRFRWTIRPFGAYAGDKTVSVPNAPTLRTASQTVTMSPSTCPFSEMSTTFGQGPTALLGVTPNPLPVSRTNFNTWTVS